MTLTAADKMQVRNELIEEGLIRSGNPALVRTMECTKCGDKFDRLKDNTNPICPNCEHVDPRKYR
jgi:predicted Zn-ribbon and HTH transcriptional regulator